MIPEAQVTVTLVEVAVMPQSNTRCPRSLRPEYIVLARPQQLQQQSSLVRFFRNDVVK
jgi:hypothetical protein